MSLDENVNVLKRKHGLDDRSRNAHEVAIQLARSGNHREAVDYFEMALGNWEGFVLYGDVCDYGLEGKLEKLLRKCDSEQAVHIARRLVQGEMFGPAVDFYEKGIINEKINESRKASWTPKVSTLRDIGDIVSDTTFRFRGNDYTLSLSSRDHVEDSHPNFEEFEQYGGEFKVGLAGEEVNLGLILRHYQRTNKRLPREFDKVSCENGENVMGISSNIGYELGFYTSGFWSLISGTDAKNIFLSVLSFTFGALMTAYRQRKRLFYSPRSINVWEWEDREEEWDDPPNTINSHEYIGFGIKLIKPDTEELGTVWTRKYWNFACEVYPRAIEHLKLDIEQRCRERDIQFS